MCGCHGYLYMVPCGVGLDTCGRAAPRLSSTGQSRGATDGAPGAADAAQCHSSAVRLHTALLCHESRVWGSAAGGGGRGEAEHPAPCSWVCLFPDPPCEMGRDAIQGSSDGRESLREGTGTGAARSLLVLCPSGNTEGCCWESVWVGTWSTTCCFPWKETGEFTARHRRSERAMPGLCRAQQWVPESTGQG